MERSIIMWISLIFLINVASASKILMMHTTATYSHKVSMFPLADALASRGHEVIYISPLDPMSGSNPKVEDIFVPSLAEFVNVTLGSTFNIEARATKTIPKIHDIAYQLELGGCQLLLSSPEFKSFIEKHPKVDLIIQDLSVECGLGIAHKMGAKMMAYNTLPYFTKLGAMLGIPIESGTVDGIETDTPSLSESPSLMYRIQQTLDILKWEYKQYLYSSYIEEMLKTALQLEKVPSLYELYENIAVVLSTGNFISDQPRSLPPMFVNVPALHVKEAKKGSKLPKELDDFINSKNPDGSQNEGFIYISLGTVVVAADLPEHIRQSFWSTIKAFPKTRFLWRWGGEFPKEKPDNLYIAKWFPQQDLLSHSKIRAFVTQMGRPSMQEALSIGVPTIAFPVVGDQDFNAMRLEEIGAGVTLELTTVKEAELTEAVNKVLYNTKFQKRVKEVSKLFKDAPMSPKDTAVWWVEYVLRHEDFTHLKPMGRKQTWYERRMLDVWFTIFSVGLGSLLIVSWVGLRLLKYFLKLDKQEKKQLLVNGSYTNGNVKYKAS